VMPPKRAISSVVAVKGDVMPVRIQPQISATASAVGEMPSASGVGSSGPISDSVRIGLAPICPMIGRIQSSDSRITGVGSAARSISAAAIHGPSSAEAVMPI